MRRDLLSAERRTQPAEPRPLTRGAAVTGPETLTTCCATGRATRWTTCCATTTARKRDVESSYPPGLTSSITLTQSLTRATPHFAGRPPRFRRSSVPLCETVASPLLDDVPRRRILLRCRHESRMSTAVLGQYEGADSEPLSSGRADAWLVVDAHHPHTDRGVRWRSSIVRPPRAAIRRR